MYAMRNQLIHGYLHVNYAIIWAVAEKEIPNLISGLEATLANWPSDLS